jgi:hypothetical protein
MVAVLSLSLVAGSAIAAAKHEAAGRAAPVTKDQRDKGMAAAPDLIAAAGIQCQLADARLIGESSDPKTKAKRTFYELACSDNEGVVVAKLSDQPALVVVTCLETSAPTADGKPNGLMCVLPGNSDPKAGLLAYVAKAGTVCTPDQIRALGHSAVNTDFELKCHEGGGYILKTSVPPRLDKPITVEPCVIFDPAGNVKCELTDRAAQLGVADRLAAQSGKNCTVKDRAYVGITEKGEIYYEVACQDGKGYVLEEAPNGALTKTIDCASADYLNGGCKLTDARSAKTEQSGLYTQLARKAGFACDVSGYAPFSINLAGKEVVELACSNRPDGGIAIFSASPGAAAVIYDCAHSELEKFRCGLTKPAAAYPKLTDELKTLGKTSCAVSNSRTVGVTADQRGFIEVACSDGLPGYMIEYGMAPLAPKNAIACASAASIAGGCTLPGNGKKS